MSVNQLVGRDEAEGSDVQAFLFTIDANNRVVIVDLLSVCGTTGIERVTHRNAPVIIKHFKASDENVLVDSDVNSRYLLCSINSVGMNQVDLRRLG